MRMQMRERQREKMVLFSCCNWFLYFRVWFEWLIQLVCYWRIKMWSSPHWYNKLMSNKRIHKENFGRLTSLEIVSLSEQMYGWMNAYNIRNAPTVEKKNDKWFMLLGCWSAAFSINVLYTLWETFVHIEFGVCYRSGFSHGHLMLHSIFFGFVL